MQADPQMMLNQMMQYDASMMPIKSQSNANMYQHGSQRWFCAHRNFNVIPSRRVTPTPKLTCTILTNHTINAIEHTWAN
jgi:hypothetical protein